MRAGDVFTLAGVYELDRRWWPRLKAWLLRQPVPRTRQLVRFVCAEDVPQPIKPYQMIRVEALDN